jgi:hypothetical protein
MFKNREITKSGSTLATSNLSRHFNFHNLAFGTRRSGGSTLATPNLSQESTFSTKEPNHGS